MVELDGKNGIIRAKKGIWEGAMWQQFKQFAAGTTLDPQNPNIRVSLASLTSPTPNLFLPVITRDLDGAKFCFFWDGNLSRNGMQVQTLKTSGNDIIGSIECINYYSGGGFPEISRIWAEDGRAGYLELVAIYGAGSTSSSSVWVIIGISGKHWKVELKNGQETTLETLINNSNS